MKVVAKLVNIVLKEHIREMTRLLNYQLVWFNEEIDSPISSRLSLPENDCLFQFYLSCSQPEYIFSDSEDPGASLIGIDPGDRYKLFCAA